ncbi:MAG: hydantoinase/oxoprolinase family protein [Candidatus Dormiibacterota bacterium]
MSKQIAVDVGGTFTDVVFSDDESGRVVVAKGATVPASPEVGVLRLVDSAIATADLEASDYFLHGTTVGLNALLQREGVCVGLIATQGFRDVLEIRRGDRGDPYDLFWTQPPALVPRRLRIPVNERILPDGSVSTALRSEDVVRAYEVFASEAVVSVAIALMNAYANPVHELAIEAQLRELGFTGPISLSHRMSKEYREYERTSTTVIDAYVRPRVSEYLGRLGAGLRERGFIGQALITRCGGGALNFDQASSRPFETIISGPVAGVVGAAVLARQHGFDRAISADVGGTSFDTCLIVDGQPKVKYEGVVEGMPVQTEWVDVRSIGAGGGSIAYTDAGGLLRVGPRSAGAVPGPACYGRGGVEPTTTDAAMALGLVGSGELAGELKLDGELARESVARATNSGAISNESAARGILEVSTAIMAGAIREITVEQGEDPRRAALVAFGGAGPVYATLLARELDIGTILVPVHAGNFSACGLLASDLVQSSAQTKIVRLRPDVMTSVQPTVDSLCAELTERGTRADSAGGVKFTSAVDMRFVGQEHTLTIPLAMEARRITTTASELGEAFMRQYKDTFGLVLVDTEIEIVTARASLSVSRGGSLPSVGDTLHRDRVPWGRGRAWSFERGTWQEFDLVPRESLPVGTKVIGPAVIAELTATTYLDYGYVATVCDDFVLEVRRTPQSS